MSTTKLILPSGEIIESENPDNLLGFLGKKPKYVPNATGVETAKRKYGKRRTARMMWTGHEIETIAQNLNKGPKELIRLVPGRTLSAVGNIKWQLKRNKLSKAKEKAYTDFLNHR